MGKIDKLSVEIKNIPLIANKKEELLLLKASYE